MLIGFTGPQSSGKSTLLQSMHTSDKFRKCSFVKEVTRKVASKGLAINQSGDNLTQLHILNEHLNNHTHNGECTVLDRCIIDGYIYTDYLHSIGLVDSWVLDYAGKLLSLLGPQLSVVLYTDPADVNLVDDGVRSTDSSFRNTIIEMFDDFISDTALLQKVIPNANVVKLSGDVNTRLRLIEQSI